MEALGNTKRDMAIFHAKIEFAEHFNPSFYLRNNFSFKYATLLEYIWRKAISGKCCS